MGDEKESVLPKSVCIRKINCHFGQNFFVCSNFDEEISL